MGPNNNSPMEYMVNFFASIFEVLAKAIMKVGSAAYNAHEQRKRNSLIDINGQKVPFAVSEKMAYNNMDITREMARKWNKKDLKKYTEDWNKLDEREKQRRRDEFAKKAMGPLRKAADRYYKETGYIIENLDAYSIADRNMQPIYQATLHQKNNQNNNQNNNPTNNMEKQDEPVKQENIQKQLSNQSEKERQLDEIKNDELSGKKSVEIEKENKEIAKSNQGFSGRKKEEDYQSELNKEINSLNGKENEQSNIEKNNEREPKVYNSSNDVDENGKYSNLEVETVEHEEFWKKVKENAPKRQEVKAKNGFEMQRTSDMSNSMNNNKPMVPGK
ncbi:MAG: hypothetical protein K6A23_10325 [Butyrivibrio sp.]|nr:hypothetical protein [Butyrivibrio sp.]